MPGERGVNTGADAAQQRPTVLYVMGAGRSGSTILGVTLGNCENVFFAGELDRWFTKGGVARGDGARMAVWQEVAAQMGDAQGLFAERTGLLDRSSALLDPRTWPLRRRLRARYRAASRDLYLAIARSTGATHIVDSSHYPLRARELRELDGVDVHILFLVRDARRIVASLDRDDVRERRFGLPAANAYLWLTYALSLCVFLRWPRPRRMFVRYEQFLADPAGVLGTILTTAHSDAAPPATRELDTGAPFHGNRLLDADQVTLAGPPAGPPPRSPLTTALQLPWRAIFACLRPAARASRAARAPLRSVEKRS